MRIYAADDEILARSLLEEAIRAACPEAELQMFRSGRELLEASKQALPDVVFTDILMPGMTGLETAEALKELSDAQDKKVNVIFVTGFTEYTGEAFRLFASGYVNKPVDPEQVRHQLQNLRYPLSAAPRASAHCFGNFTLLLGGRPVHFSRTKGQELFAYLVDRDGALVSRKELALVLFEDDTFSRETQKNLTNIVRAVEQDLDAAGIPGLFIHSVKGYSVDRDQLECDLFRFLKGEKELFTGEYMEQYSWGEEFKGRNFNIL